MTYGMFNHSVIGNDSYLSNNIVLNYTSEKHIQLLRLPDLYCASNFWSKVSVNSFLTLECEKRGKHSAWPA